MIWCRQAKSHHLGQNWPRYMSSTGVIMPQCVKNWSHVKLGKIQSPSTFVASIPFLALRPAVYQVKVYTRSLKTKTWWRHQMETFSASLVICAGNSPVPVNSLHKGQWRGAFMFSLICARINGWVNNREAGDLRRYRAHYDVIVMRRDYVHWSWYTHAQTHIYISLNSLSLIGMYSKQNSLNAMSCLMKITCYTVRYISHLICLKIDMLWLLLKFGPLKRSGMANVFRCYKVWWLEESPCSRLCCCYIICVIFYVALQIW